eukprot:GEMP01069270.1.p1 GENE.GEMP01069270.1~~GEMP01069270.1.p1  ORF type:complete len:190 (+),score=28.52 GEMP01069270.1:279-848(+)
MVMLDKLRELLLDIGWDKDISMGGLSLGCSIITHYVIKYGGVSHMVLIAPAGRQENSVTRIIRKAVRLPLVLVENSESMASCRRLRRTTTVFHRLAAHLALLQDTPDYLLPQDAPQRLREQNVHICIRQAVFDVFHTSNLPWWSNGRRVDGSENVDGRCVIADHVLLCVKPEWFDVLRRESWLKPEAKL